MSSLFLYVFASNANTINMRKMNYTKINITKSETQDNINNVNVKIDPERAFIPNLALNTITQCRIDPKTGLFNNCSDTGATELDFPYIIRLNKNSTIAYISSLLNRGFTMCHVNKKTGSFSQCSITGPEKLNLGVKFTINASGNKAFIALPDKGEIIRCMINSKTSEFYNCKNISGKNIFIPDGIALNTNQTRAYLINDNNSTGLNSTVLMCKLKRKSGFLKKCQPAGGIKSNYEFQRDITLNNDDTRAYVQISDQKIEQCAIDHKTGLFIKCSDSNGYGFFRAGGIAFNRSGTRVYITSVPTLTVTQCKVTPKTGLFYECSNAGGSQTFSFPHGIALN